MASKKNSVVEPSKDTAALPLGAATFTAPKQREYLKKALDSWSDSREQTVPIRPASPPNVIGDRAEQADEPDLWRKIANLIAARKRTVLKSLFALALAITSGWLPLQHLLATASTQAVVNARTITIRAPITGQVTLASELKIGSALESGVPLFSIHSTRADTSNVNNLRRALAQIDTQMATFKSKQSVLLKTREKLNAQAERYRLGRAETVAFQISGVDSQIAAAKAQYEHATAVLARARALVPNGSISQASFDQSQRDHDVARETLAALRERRKGLELERTAAEHGTYVTEGYSDSSQSAQRSLDVELELADIEARLAGSSNERSILEAELKQEGDTLLELTNATVHASTNGRIWEIAVSSGEYVNSGDVLARLIDCASASVRASVDESTYQKLRVGQPATFRPRDGGPSLKGWVEDLTGLARVGRNDAIDSGALSRADYHVTLAFPQLASRTDCVVSRSGLVIFE